MLIPEPTAPIPSVDVAAGLLVTPGRVLISQRPPGGHLAGLWEFPGGKREPGESWEDCLRRELLEELNLIVRVGRLFETVVHPYPQKVVHLRFYLCQQVGGTLTCLGCSDARWVEWQDLGRFEFPAADHSLVHRLVEERPEFGA